MTLKVKSCLDVIIKTQVRTLKMEPYFRLVGGRVPLNKDEWFNVDDVIEVISLFTQNQALPENIYWREIRVLDQDGN